MSALFVYVLSLLGAHTVTVEPGQPTGNLERGDVIVQLHTSAAECADAGGRSFGTICVGLDF